MGSKMLRSSIGRRRLLNWFLGTSAGALLASALYPLVRFLVPPELTEAITNQLDAGFVNDRELVEKGFKILRFGLDPVILVKVTEGEFRAFSAVCTHLDCTVTFRKELQLIWCYCHNGVYDLTGRNIAGPPPRPLAPFRVHVVPGTGGQPDSLVVERF
jgi:cytochrome b6-f complex iron-sulfur subunit